MRIHSLHTPVCINDEVAHRIFGDILVELTPASTAHKCLNVAAHMAKVLGLQQPRLQRQTAHDDALSSKCPPELTSHMLVSSDPTPKEGRLSILEQAPKNCSEVWDHIRPVKDI